MVEWYRVEWLLFDPADAARVDLAASPDVTLLEEQTDYLKPFSTLWVLLYGLRAAPKYVWDAPKGVSPDDLWLIELMKQPGAYNDPPALVLAALYQSFHEANPDMTHPVPDELKRASPTFVNARYCYAPEWLLAALED